MPQFAFCFPFVYVCANVFFFYRLSAMENIYVANLVRPDEFFFIL